MKYLILSLSLFLAYLSANSQISEKAFLKTYNKINSKKIFNLDKSDSVKYAQDTTEIGETQRLLTFYNSYLEKEYQRNGKAGFSFNGNENNLNSLYKIGVNGKIDKGSYPYELDFTINTQTTIQDGVFQENISDIDVSFDFHPLALHPNYSKSDLWLETYTFAKRFKNNFLGIEQRYEVGAGVIFNCYSGRKRKKRNTKSPEFMFTNTGLNNLKGLNKLPKYKILNDSSHTLRRCLETCYSKESILDLTKEDIDALVNINERYKQSNIKKYSKLRLALLVGVYYELEEAVAKNQITLDERDSIITRDFSATNRFCYELRPTLVLQPMDKCKLKFYPYIKMPFSQRESIVQNLEDNSTSDDTDYFLDVVTSFEIILEDNFSISLNHRFIYDNAPRRANIQQMDGSYIFLTGQKKNSIYGISFNFGF